jgi:hypothetical protein
MARYYLSRTSFGPPSTAILSIRPFSNGVSCLETRTVNIIGAILFRIWPDLRRNYSSRLTHSVQSAIIRDEFIRRFLLHVLPKGFHRIRHYGLLASATCKANIARAKELIATPLPSIDPSIEHDDADMAAGAVMDHRPP